MKDVLYKGRAPAAELYIHRELMTSAKKFQKGLFHMFWHPAGNVFTTVNKICKNIRKLSQRTARPARCRILAVMAFSFIYTLASSTLLISETLAASYYISPTGSDSNSGTSPNSPWKTFGFAVPKLKPGDTLILRDGTYNNSNSGYPYISCGSNASNGTSSAPIKFKAENERQAFISGPGHLDAFRIRNCSWWVIEGLRIQSADFNISTGDAGHAVFGTQVKNTVWRRNLLRFNNRYRNSHLINLEYGIENNLFEENEFYSYHRHALAITQGTGNIVRRNYFNSREHADLTGCQNLGIPWCSADPKRGEAGIALYPASNSILENNIYEATSHPVELNGGTVNNRLFGEVAYNVRYGILPNARGSTLSAMPRDTLIQNHVWMGGPITASVHGAFWAISAKNTRCDNCSFINTAGQGLKAQLDSGAPGDGYPSTFSDNSLFLNVSGGAWYVASQSNYLIDYARIFNSGNPMPGLSDPKVTNETTINPNMGACYVFIPDGSNLKGAGKNGADIGANVLYRYQSGVLTGEPLWNPATGAYPHGAIIPGVNDVAGSSVFDVHKRLNVNFNGCSLPAGYGQSTSGGTGTPSSGSLAHSGTMIANSVNFASDHPVERLWDGCLDGTPSCTSGNGNISSFWIEFDLGKLHDLTQARLFGDADFQWVSTSWKLLYKKNLADPWTTAFSNVNALFNGWSTQALSRTARYVRVEVFGNQSIPATQARELEIYGTPITVTAPPVPPGNLSVSQQ